MIQGVNELGDVGRRDLVVGGQRHDDLAGGPLEAGHQRGRLAEWPGEADDGDALALLEQALEPAGELSLRSVENVNDFMVAADGIEPATIVRVQRERIAVPRPDGNDYGDLGRNFRVTHALWPPTPFR